MSDGIPDKKVDEDWKRRVSDEKSMAAQAPPKSVPAAGRAPGGGRPEPAAPAAAPADRGAPARGGAGGPRPGGGPGRSKSGVQFLQFVQALTAQALMGLGQIEIPMTGQIDQDLQQAHHTIETLLMLQEKTQGNLTPEEEQALAQIVRELQVAYVQLAS